MLICDFVLDKALGQHCLCDLDKAGDICADDEVARLTVFFRGLAGVLVNRDHNVLEFPRRPFRRSTGFSGCFCAISRPDTATPPALAALPGRNSTLLCRNTSAASGVQGIFAPSPTAMQPFFASVFAPASSSSFCVAQGSAISHLTFHIPAQPSVYLAFGDMRGIP